MLKTSELTGAQLDYWTARAEGIPAVQLTIRRVQRSTDRHCVRCWTVHDLAPVNVIVLAYSADFTQGWPLVEKYDLKLEGWTGDWIAADASFNSYVNDAQGDTPLIAICRAVVRAAFGDEVEEVAVCE